MAIDPDSTIPPAPSGPAVAIVGAGLSGLGYLHGFHDLPLEARKGWTIDCFERREKWGGIWLPQPGVPDPDVEPESPNYPALDCLAISTGMTFTGRPLPPSTRLFAQAPVILKYVDDHVRDFGLDQYIKCKHDVDHAQLLEGEENASHPWVLTITDKSVTPPRTVRKRYSDLIIGSGVTPFHRHFVLPWEEEWLADSSERKIMHSAWYRDPSVAKGKFVILEGYNPSGDHIVRAIQPYARELHHAYTPSKLPFKLFPDVKSANYHAHQCRIVSFGKDLVTFQDGSTLATPPDTLIIRATGYEISFRMLGDELVRPVQGDKFSWDDPAMPLENNTRYIRPLYKCLVPMEDKFPPGSLAFACQFPILYNLPTGYVQGLWHAHLLANLDAGDNFLPGREEALKGIREMEKRQEIMHMPMAARGYPLFPFGKATDDYNDSLIEEVRAKSRFDLPERLTDPSKPFTEPWRRRVFEVTLPLYRAYQEAKAQGIQDTFSEGCVTEADYAVAVERLVQWWNKEKVNHP